MKERRKAARLKTEISIRWSRLFDTTGKTNEYHHSDITKNIGEGGVRIVAFERLQVHDELDLEIRLPGRTIEHVRGKVAWINEISDSVSTVEARFAVGVQFLNLSDLDKKLIKEFVYTRRRQRFMST